MDTASFLGMRYNNKEEFKLEIGEIVGGNLYRRGVYLRVAERMPDTIPEMKLLAGLNQATITVITGLVDDYVEEYYKDCSVEGFRQYLAEPKHVRQALLKKYFGNVEMEDEAVFERLAFNCEIGEPYRSLLFAYFKYPTRYMEKILPEVDRAIECVKQIHEEFLPAIMDMAKQFSYPKFQHALSRVVEGVKQQDYQEIWLSATVVNPERVYEVARFPLRVLILGIEYDKNLIQHPLRQTMSICHALGDEARVHIMEQLVFAHESTINEIIESSGKARNTVVHHMEVLKNANLVKVKKQGKKTLFYPNKKVMEEYIQLLQWFVNDME